MRIIQTGTAFWGAKALNTATELKLFTALAGREMSGTEIQAATGIHERGLYDFLDALVAMGFLERTGQKETAQYKNAQESEIFLDMKKPSYVGGMLEFADKFLYGSWAHLKEALQTGQSVQELKHGGRSMFEVMLATEEDRQLLMRSMGGIQMENFRSFAQGFDFSPFKILCDLGGGGGHLSVAVAEQHAHVQCITFDLPPLQLLVTQFVERMGMSGRITPVSGNFFEDDFPAADLYTFGNILHSWSLEQRKCLM